jgi:hypothetical protein
MKIHITKNYFFNDESKVLYRIISENKHILWRPKYHGLPAFNAEIFNQYKDRCLKIGWISRITDRPSYRYSMEIKDFDERKETINDREPQYVVAPLSSWNCEEIN